MMNTLKNVKRNFPGYLYQEVDGLVVYDTTPTRARAKSLGLAIELCGLEEKPPVVKILIPRAI